MKAQVQADTQMVSLLQGEGKSFCERRKGNHRSRKKLLLLLTTGANKMRYSVALPGCLLILSLEREFIINSACCQDACFPVSFLNSCF